MNIKNFKLNKGTFKKFIRRLFNVALIFFSTLSITTSHANAQDLPLDPAVRYGRLPNGLTYFIRHNEEPKKRAVLYLVNNVGSVLENDNQQGLAHFMEHMSFNGTKHYPKNELVDFLQKSGIRFGADLNAHTNFDETVYELPLPTNNPVLFHQGIQILRDWSQDALLDSSEIEKERGVVLEEKRIKKGVGERLRSQYWPVLLSNSRYVDRLPIGIDSVLNNFKPETIRSFYRDWYRPDLQAVIIVGDINVDETEKEIKTLFSDLKNPIKERKRTIFEVPLTGSNHFLALTDKEQSTRKLQIYLKHKSVHFLTVADYRKHLIETIFNNLIQNRYQTISHSATPPFISGSASLGAFFSGVDVAGISVTTDSAKMEIGTKAIWREVERVRRFGFTETEFERIKRAILSEYTNALLEKNKTNSSSYAESYKDYFLKNSEAMGIERETRLIEELLPAISLNEVNNEVNQFDLKSNRDILILAPEADEKTLPDEQTVLSWLSDVSKEVLTPFKDDINPLPLTKGKPRSGRIISQSYDKALNLTYLKLSNGINVLIKPTNFKNDEILFEGFSDGGTSIFSDKDFQSALNAVNLMVAGGVGNYSNTQLNHFLEDKQIGLAPYISDDSYGISGNSNKADLDLAFKLLFAFMTEPRKDTTAFKGIIQRSKAILQNRLSNPEAVFSDTIAAVLGNYNVRQTGPSVEKMSQINLTRSYNIYKQLFSNASGFTFVIVGNVKLDSVKLLIEKYLAGLPSSTIHFKSKNLHIYPPSGFLEKTVRKGNEDKSTVILHYGGMFDFSNEAGTGMSALAEVLQIRLLERLREDESEVYSPSVSASAKKLPEGRFVFTIQFSCSPKNAEKLVASTMDEIAKIQSSGPTEINLQKWKAETKTAFTPQLSENGFWLKYLVGSIQNKQSVHLIDSYNQNIDNITGIMIKDLANKYLKTTNLIEFKLLPETNSSFK